MAVANVDAHVSVPAAEVVEPGRMVMVMGTSTCHLMLSDHLSEVPMCGVVDGGIVPGLYGYEAGQSGVGDIFAWFVKHAVPPEYHEASRTRGIDLHDYLESEASNQEPGEHGLLALDWWNGNRSVLVDAELSGLLVGATLSTRAPDIYRALVEATAYGTRTIVESFEERGVPVDELIVAGGSPRIECSCRSTPTSRGDLLASSAVTRVRPWAARCTQRSLQASTRTSRLRPSRWASCAGRLQARRGTPGDVRCAVRRVPGPARLFRSRGERCDEALEGNPAQGQGGEP